MGKRMKHVTAIFAALTVTLFISLGVYAMGGSAFFSGSDTVATVQSTASNTSTSVSVTANTSDTANGNTTIQERLQNAQNVDDQDTNQAGADLIGVTN